VIGEEEEESLGGGTEHGNRRVAIKYVSQNQEGIFRSEDAKTGDDASFTEGNETSVVLFLFRTL